MSNTAHIFFHLVDDNDIDLAVNSKLLELSGISKNITTYNGATTFLEAIESKQDQFLAQKNIVLLDIMMPRINGFDCLDRLSAMPAELQSVIRVYMLSSSIDRKDIQRAESYALVEKVLEKPLDIYVLQNYLRNMDVGG
jgi:CheY-like chemotaxis protein